MHFRRFSILRIGQAAAVAIAVLLVQPLTALRADAQTPSQTGSVSGVVLDAGGRVVVNATVVIRNETSGLTRAVISDGSGRFISPGLETGTYTVEASAPGMAMASRANVQVAADQTQDLQMKLAIGDVKENVTVTAAAASTSAPSQPLLTARSAQSVVSREFIENNTTPAADYSQVMLTVPGMFSYSSNGPGMSDTKTFFRGFKDGQYNIMFDGIPFYDTNDPTHHSWTFFPTQFLGGAVVDRSPGSAASIGPTTFGGSVNLQSRNLGSAPHLVATASYGSFGTQQIGGEYESGGTTHKFIANATDSRSDGYQTYNQLQRDSVSGKYVYAPSQQTQVTMFSGYVHMTSNTPDWKDPLRGEIASLGDNYLMNNDPTSPEYFGYEHYHVTTDFSYVGVKHDMGNGWSIDNKSYLYAYHNHEHFNAQTGKISATSGTDKLNAYRTLGNIIPVTHVSRRGIFRTGLWSQYSWTNRYQTPEDPRTGPDYVTAALPNFHETFGTLSLQPYMEYEYHALPNLKLTPGIKYSVFRQDFVQYADNGKTVGDLGGAPSVSHDVTYRTWLPSFDAHYLISGMASVYGQYAKGDAIPPTKVFDVKGGGPSVGTLPKPTVAETYQAGTVFQARRVNLGFDVFHTHFDNTYSSVLNKETNEIDFFPSGSSNSNGAEAEANFVAGGGLNLYVNGTALRARYADTGQFVQNSPQHTEAVGITYAERNFLADVFFRHAGAMFNDNGSVHEAIPINSVNLTNLSFSYRITGPSLRDVKIRFSVNNLFNDHNIIAVAPISKTSNAPSPNDSVTLLAARSAALTFTFDLARR